MTSITLQPLRSDFYEIYGCPQCPWIEGGPLIIKSLNCAGGFAFPEKSAGTSQPARPEVVGAVGPEDVPAVYSTPSTVQTADSGDLLLNILDLALPQDYTNG